MRITTGLVTLGAMTAILLGHGAGRASAEETVVFEDASVRVVRVPAPAHQSVALGSHMAGAMIALPRQDHSSNVSWLLSGTPTVENAGAEPQDLVIVELKTTPTAPPKVVIGNTPAPPREGLEIRNLLDNEFVAVDLYRLAPGYKDPRAHPHTWLSVFVHLADNDIEGAGPGSVRKKVARGDVDILPPNVIHGFGNDGTVPAEFLYVRIK